MTTNANGTQAVDRAAELLTRVVHGPASFTELTAASGLARSTTSRLLMALERHQLVRRDSGGKFLPGELFVRYAWRGTAGTDLVAIARPFLDKLGEQTGETINLGVATGGTSRAGGGGAGGTAGAGGGGGGTAGAGATAGAAVQQIAQVDSRYLIGGTNWIGLVVPLHCSAQGKVLLAFGAAELPPGPLPACTPRTITSRTDLHGELARVREQGWAVTDEELEPGLVAVAAPVFADGAAAIAAVSVSAPSSRLTPDQIPAIAAKCVAVAGDLSATLGSGGHP